MDAKNLFEFEVMIQEMQYILFYEGCGKNFKKAPPSVL